MSKIEWKKGPARHKNGIACEIIAVLDNGMPVVRYGSGSYKVHSKNGTFDQDDALEIELDLIPPRERVEGYLWVLKGTGELYSVGKRLASNPAIQDIPITIERNEVGEWELVK